MDTVNLQEENSGNFVMSERIHNAKRFYGLLMRKMFIIITVIWALTASAHADSILAALHHYSPHSETYWQNCQKDFLKKIEPNLSSNIEGITVNPFGNKMGTLPAIACTAGPLNAIDLEQRFYTVFYYFTLTQDAGIEPNPEYNSAKIMLLLQHIPNKALKPIYAVATNEDWIQPPALIQAGSRDIILIRHGTGNADGQDIVLSAFPVVKQLDISSWLSDKIEKPPHYKSFATTAIGYGDMTVSIMFGNTNDISLHPVSKDIFGQTDIDLIWKDDRLSVKHSHYIPVSRSDLYN